MTKSKDDKNSVVEILNGRISAIVANMQANDKLDISLEKMASLTDQELLSVLLDVQIGISNSNERLIKKLKRQKEGQQKFLDYISRNGGWCTQMEYAEILGVSRQAVSNRISNGSLLAITVNGKKVVPLFQVDENTAKEIPILSKVNKILLNQQEIGVSSACTFWLMDIDGMFDNRREYVIMADSESMFDRVIHSASLCGEMGK
jgi:predicted transcriptional regulator